MRERPRNAAVTTPPTPPTPQMRSARAPISARSRESGSPAGVSTVLPDLRIEAHAA